MTDKETFTIEEKLDLIINKLKTDKGASVSSWALFRNRIGSDEVEFDMLFYKLKKDLLISEYDKYPVVLTVEGMMFKGYVQTLNDEILNREIQRNEMQRRIRNDQLLARGTIGAAIGTIGLLIWELVKRFCGC